MCISEDMPVSELFSIYVRRFLFSGFIQPYFIQDGKYPLISHPKLTSASGEA